MTYEIPQQLEYKEKIVFGLTFTQLLHAMIFLPIAVALLLKLPLELPYRITISLIPSGLAIIFMFTDLPKEAKNFAKWLLKREFNEDNMYKFLKIDKIKNNIIKVKDKKISILKIEPINFSIRNEQEKQIVITQFQKFLNSLSFPVQIVIATDNLNLDIYLAKLQKKVEDNDEYLKIYEDFRKHLTKISQSLLNRSFYIVIKERDNLDIQIKVIENLLNSMNLRYKLLEDDELSLTLKSFFHDIYSEESTEDKDYLDTIPPKKVINHTTELQTDQTFTRTIAIRGYPRTVEEGFLDKLVTINGSFDLALHIEPYDIEQTMIMLNKELQKQRGDLWAMQNKDMINPTLEIQYEDTQKVLENMQKGNEKLFNISLYITCKANSKEELNLLTKKVESELHSLLMLSKLPRYEMHKGLKSVIPLGEDYLNIKRNITTQALSAFFPFTSQFLQVDDTGILLGLNKHGIPIIKDLFKLYNANGVVLASSGGGKSYFTKLMISRLLLNGTKVMVIDPQAEYLDLVDRFNGQVVTISKNSDTIINPLDLMGHDYDEKKLTLLELFPIMLGQTSEIQKAVLDKALTEVYEAKGITNKKKTWHFAPPKMEDLLKQLKQMSKTATKIESETYRSLINRIEMYVTGVFSFLNKQTNLNFDNRLVCFNIGDMPSQVKPVVMFLVLDYVYMKMKKDIERKILVIDEAWSLLQRAEDEGYVFKIVKTCRKFNLGLLLITQDVGDLLKNDAGKALLNNSEYTLLLRQKPSIIESIENTFQLSTHERERLLTAATGEGVLIISNEHTEIKIISSPEEHQVITTNADERLAKEHKNINEVVTEFQSCLDYTKGIFKRKELTNDEVDDLLDHGYKISQQVGLFGGQQEQYLLKPRSNESTIHFFIIKMIEEYLLEYFEKVELFETKDADIVFEADDRKIAIEVETGKRHISRVKKKVKLLNKAYGDDWFFVVTNWEYKEKYQKLGKTYVRREVPATLSKHYISPGSNIEGTGSETSKNKGFEVQTSCHIEPSKSKTLNQEGGKNK
jgi:conjugal transfer ATP-binding protein TraC